MNISSYTIRVLFIAGVLLLAANLLSCSFEDQAAATNPPPVTSTPATNPPPTSNTPADTANSPAILADITIDATGPGTPVDPHLLGSNVPAWLNPTRLSDGRFQTRSTAAGLTIVRMPGGSWSNWYDWLACERDGQGIDADAVCYWPWAATPSDFIIYLRATALDGMYTINMNGTAKEAAALVAFFNGSVADDTSIGVDVRGRDWSKVSDWAQLRADHGNPEPLHIAYWEIGNEIYGGKSGKDCVSWGWEEVWTCDGTEYVTGIGSGVDRREGYLEFRDAMRAVDPTIKVGAVGIPFQADWSNWGNEVIAAAGDVMDFYVIHHYGYFDPPASQAEALALPQQTWAQIMPDVRAAFDQHAGGREVPVAITEYNLFSVQERDSGDWMSRAVNGLYLADNLGQMMVHGVTMANQWDIAHGEGAANPGYGLMQADTYFASPQYYALALWSRFGNIKLPVSSEFSAADTLSVYGGRVDDNTVSVLAINKTGDSVAATIQLDGISTISGATLDIMQANSLDDLAVTFNGVANPADDLSNAPSINLPISGNPIAHTFAPYSVTLLRLEVESTTPTATAVPPTATAITPTETPVITPAPTGTPVFTPEAAIMMPIITSAENSGNEP